MRSLPIAAVTLSLLALSPWALAQDKSPTVSETELEGARKLFRDGVELQKAGNYTEALDKFQRAQRVYPAPTTLVRIAECQAALGKLVDAAEKYRQVIRTPLAEGASPAFQQAREQAKGELAQLEPRIPRLKVDVKADPAEGKEAPGGQPPSNLQIEIDGQKINAALVGEPLLVDPGTHKVVVTAPGYTQGEQLVTIGDKEARSIGFQLKYTGIMPSPDPTQPPPPLPPPPDKVPLPPSAQSKPNRAALIVGGRAGLLIPSGKTGSSGVLGSGVDSITNANVGAAGGALALDLGVRFTKHFYVGATLEGSAFGKGADGNEGDPKWSAQSSKANGALIGVEMAYFSNPEKVGFYGALGVGYRIYAPSVKSTNAAGEERTIDYTYKGADFALSAGMSIAASPHFLIIPKATLMLGSYSEYDTSCSTSGSDTLCADWNRSGQKVTDQATHTFFFLGVGGYYSTDL